MNTTSMGYVRVVTYYRRSSSSTSSSSSSSTCRGFRLKPRKFSVQKLRSRLSSLFMSLRRLRSSCGWALRLLWRRRRPRRRIERSSSSGNSSRRRMILGAVEEPCTVRPSYRYGSLDRSNSFYAEAIADCLDFIRRSSVSTDQSSSSPKADI